ncbi:hypothetical protein [Pedobacter agri]|uniref:hypothetical protein n=1 Tax=Pedobacter agri TaxID=454586 RepID=UPI0027891FF2|nr:hypothetical protein [Pedobacter agri]MDQ1140533.1 hypothetical protein [Pedobacter agri]
MYYLILYLTLLLMNFRRERQNAIDLEIHFPFRKFFFQWILIGIVGFSKYIIVSKRYYKIVDYAFNDSKAVDSIRAKITGNWKFEHRKTLMNVAGKRSLSVDDDNQVNKDKNGHILKFGNYFIKYPIIFWPRIYEISFTNSLTKTYSIRTFPNNDDALNQKITVEVDTMKISPDWANAKQGSQNVYLRIR